MKEFIVSLDIVTQRMSAQDFTHILGVEDLVFDSREFEGRILWRVESNLEKTTTLLEHVNAIFNRVPISFLRDKKRKLPFESAYINVGVFHDTITCTVEIPYECVEMLKKHGVGIQINNYLSEAEDVSNGE
jgi:hypothetical protein